MEAGKKRLAGDTARAANNEEVTELRREGRDMKEVVAELTLENRLLKKHDRRWGHNGNHLWRSSSVFPNRHCSRYFPSNVANKRRRIVLALRRLTLRWRCSSPKTGGRRFGSMQTKSRLSISTMRTITRRPL